MKAAYTIFPLGDSALTVDFGNRINQPTNEKVLQLFYRLQNSAPFIRDVIPAYSSLTVYYDVWQLHSTKTSAYEAAKQWIEEKLKEETETKHSIHRQVEIPVCYAETFAPDLHSLAGVKELSVDEVIHIHTSKYYRVYMIGFLPGFAYMGTVDERIATPRKSQPRLAVPAGAVGIAGEQTGIYPLVSPGGWNIIGQTPLKLFDAVRAEPVLLQPGDVVRFYTMTEDEFSNY